MSDCSRPSSAAPPRPRTQARAPRCCRTAEAVLVETGDYLLAAAEGTIDASHIVASLGDAGRQGRRPASRQGHHPGSSRSARPSRTCLRPNWRSIWRENAAPGSPSNCESCAPGARRTGSLMAQDHASLHIDRGFTLHMDVRIQESVVANLSGRPAPLDVGPFLMDTIPPSPAAASTTRLRGRADRSRRPTSLSWSRRSGVSTGDHAWSTSPAARRTSRNS